MLPRDKYTVFDRKQRGYRKGIHSELQLSRSGKDVMGGADEIRRGTEVDEDKSTDQSTWILGNGHCSTLNAFEGVWGSSCT